MLKDLGRDEKVAGSAAFLWIGDVERRVHVEKCIGVIESSLEWFGIHRIAQPDACNRFVGGQIGKRNTSPEESAAQ